MSSVDWWSVLEVAGGVVAGGVINWLFSRQASKELKREAEKLRRLALKLIQVLDGAGLIEVKEWDSETGEPSKWPVGNSLTTSWRVEAPTPRWKQIWRRVFGS